MHTYLSVCLHILLFTFSYLYWAQGTAVPVIRRAGLDGSEPETIVSTDLGNVHGLTLGTFPWQLDYIARHLCSSSGRLSKCCVLDKCNVW